MADLTPVPLDLAMETDAHINKALSDAEKYDNAPLYGESDAYNLHRLIARAYARGWKDGHMVGTTEQSAAVRRDRDRAQGDGRAEG